MYEGFFVKTKRSSMVLLDQPLDFCLTTSEERYEEIAYAVASSGREPSLSRRFSKAMFPVQVQLVFPNWSLYLMRVSFLIFTSWSAFTSIRSAHRCWTTDVFRSVFDVTPTDCLLRSTPLTFDPSLVDIFLALHCGASLCIVSKQVRQDSALFSSIFTCSHCTIAQVSRAFASFDLLF